MKTTDVICQICGHSEYSEVYSQQVLHPLWWVKDDVASMNLSYIVCHNCGFITQHPRVPRETIFEYYKNSPTPSREAFLQRKHLYTERAEFILENITNASKNRVVEVGAAYGDLLLQLGSFTERYAIEPSTQYGETLRGLSDNIHLVPCMLEELNQYDITLENSADLVVAAHVLEHTDSPRIFVRQLCGLVNEGGYLMLEVPSIEKFATCENPIFQNLFFGHLHHFSSETLTLLGLVEGLTPVRVETSSRHAYPVVRVLFQKRMIARINKERFESYVKNVTSELQSAVERLLDTIERSSGKTAIWGCGDDFIRIVDLLTESQRESLARTMILCDRNPMKQGKRLLGNVIVSPDSLILESLSEIVISVKGKILLGSIMEDVEKLFENVSVTKLFT